MTTIPGALMDLGERMIAESRRLLDEAETAKNEDRLDAMLELSGEAQGLIAACQMIRDAMAHVGSVETVAHFAERAATELGYWSEVCRQVAAELDTAKRPSAAAWAKRDTYDSAAQIVLTLAESPS